MDVQVKSGTLQGEERDGIRIVLGIPSAAPPVGDRRFAAPRALEPWAGTRNATQFAHTAPQVETRSHRFVGNEDCLVVNVYTPVADGPHLVLVWIHGGGAVTGSPHGYDGTLFAQHGVVVVTVGYRLSVPGLLSLPGVFDGDADGNFSLFDQVPALRWVQEHIAAFGGDPARGTLASPTALSAQGRRCSSLRARASQEVS